MRVLVQIADGKTKDTSFNLDFDSGISAYTKHVYFASKCGYHYNVYILNEVFNSLLDKLSKDRATHLE